MSKRRMLLTQEVSSEHIDTIYIDKGFLEQRTSTSTSEPTENAQYPNAWCTTAFPVSQGDTILCPDLEYNDGNVRVRVYKENGSYLGFCASLNTASIADIDSRYARFMVTNDYSGNPVIPQELTVEHSDGTTDVYKVLDRRYGTLYPLKDGSFAFSDGSTVEVTDGNHVKISLANTGGSKYINISNANENSNTISNANNINNQSLKYTIPSGKTAIFYIKNVGATAGNFGAETNFKTANGSISLSFHTGVFSNASPTNNTTVESTVGGDVGCLFVYTTSYNCTFEFDVEFYVDDERWI